MPSAQFASVFGGLMPLAHLPQSKERGSILENIIEPWSYLPSEVVSQNPLDPPLLQLWKQSVPCTQALHVLWQTVKRFQYVQKSMLRALRAHHQQHESQESFDRSKTRLLADLHARFTNSLPLERYSATLSFVLFSLGEKMMHLHFESDLEVEGIPQDEAEAASLLNSMMQGLSVVGLAGQQAQRAYAHASDKLLDVWVRSKFENLVELSDIREDDVAVLMEDVEHEFVPFMDRFLSELPREANRPTLELWRQHASDKLAKMRSKQVYDIILEKNEPDAHLREFTSTPAGRKYLSSSFSNQLKRRLLQPGSSTVHVLEMYMLIIETFKNIDPSGVLLHRAAEPIRAFLRARDDAVRIIILSMLERYQPAVEGSSDNFCAPIAQIMEVSKASESFKHYYRSMDLQSMDWTPDPIDAAAGHRDAAHQDAIAHLISLESKDNFIAELQNIFGERILQTRNFQFEPERQLLELFKNRFEESQIQHCEVMLQDMAESNLLNRGIERAAAGRARNDRKLAELSSSPPGPGIARAKNGAMDEHEGHETGDERGSKEVQFVAKILSHYFWPALRKQTITLPAPMQKLIDEYSSSYRSFRKSRRLKWFDTLGWVTVELELEDRTITEEVTTWQAAVIYCFTSSSSEETTDGYQSAVKKEEMASSTSTLKLTMEEVASLLSMEQSMARAALTFWVGKLVLMHDNSKDNYEVLERLPGASSSSPSSPAGATMREGQSTRGAEHDDGRRAAIEAAASASAMASAQPIALQSAQDTLSENSKIYTSFIMGMLTNQGALPVARIHIMLKMLVPGGFPFEQTELTGFLEELKGQGRLEKAAGGLWKVVRS